MTPEQRRELKAEVKQVVASAARWLLALEEEAEDQERLERGMEEPGETPAEKQLREVHQAEEAILRRLEKGAGNRTAGQIILEIGEAEKIRNISLREAVWVLIGRGKVELTGNHLLVLSDQWKSGQG